MNINRIQNNRKLWNDLHRQDQFCTRYPHERVIQFVFGNFPRKNSNKFKILDHGSGAGRHMIFLAENRYQTYGADVSRSGNSFTRRIAKHRGLAVDLKYIDSDALKYPDNFFDGIISFGVLLYLGSWELDRIISEFFRILKNNGKMLVVIRSRRDYRFKHAKSIGHGDYIIVGDNKTRVNNEKNMLMHFFTEKEIRKRFHKFKRITIDEMVNTYNNKEMVDYDFVVELKK